MSLIMSSISLFSSSLQLFILIYCEKINLKKKNKSLLYSLKALEYTIFKVIQVTFKQYWDFMNYLSYGKVESWFKSV